MEEEVTCDVIQGDCVAVLRERFADESVQCCVTSPPYWGLRDYGVEGQLGLEKTPEEYVAKMVEVFREVKRVLKADGTLWLNLGDSYATGTTAARQIGTLDFGQGTMKARQVNRCGTPDGLKTKDLCGVPWRVAFALQADGWVLRSEIIWNKPNPMPESVTDRPTKSHEQIFLFSKASWKGPERGQFGHITDQDARWIAALIDTEGCIVVKRCKHEGRGDTFAPQVSFGSTSRLLIELFVEIVGHGNIATRPGRNSPMFYWQAANGIARDFLYRIYPFLIVKQRQARIGIHVDSLTYFRGGQKLHRKQRTDEELRILDSLWARSKACNKFGSPDLTDVPEPVYGRWDSAKYYYDADAIREDVTSIDKRAGRNSQCLVDRSPNPRKGMRSSDPETFGLTRGKTNESCSHPLGRNKRSVWTVATQPYSEAHFATFPPKLIEPCILAGCPSGGLVLDPFAGSGTTLAVAQQLGRRAIGIELNSEYIALIHNRIKQKALPL